MEEKKWYNNKNTEVIVLRKEGSFICTNRTKYPITNFCFMYANALGDGITVRCDSEHIQDEKFAIIFNKKKKRAVVNKIIDDHQVMENIETAVLLWKAIDDIGINGMNIRNNSMNDYAMFTFSLFCKNEKNMWEVFECLSFVENIICQQQFSYDKQMLSHMQIEENIDQLQGEGTDERETE